MKDKNKNETKPKIELPFLYHIKCMKCKKACKRFNFEWLIYCPEFEKIKNENKGSDEG